MRTAHLVVPSWVDDPGRPSGGSHYDLRLAAELPAAGWPVVEHRVPGTWPRPDRGSLDALGDALAGVPDGGVALVDGLLASPSAAVLVPAARRVRLVVLVHLPLAAPGAGDADAVAAGEGEVLRSAAAVVATSRWTRGRLQVLHGVDPATVHVARPGVDPAPPAPGTGRGDRLLCVAAVTPGKGHDVLVEALARVRDRTWSCCCAGSVEVDPGFAGRVRRSAAAAGVDGRLRFPGALARPALEAAYAGSDLLVLPTRGETYGMVVAEALAHATPVLVSDVGGVREALGAGRAAPGMLVPPEDPGALAGALRRWLGDPALRSRLRAAARERRAALPGWPATAATVARVLDDVAG